MRVVGMKARWSPMPKATEPQRQKIEALIGEARAEGRRVLTVRHCTYIGPGCLAERGAITVDVDGFIYANVMPDGLAV